MITKYDAALYYIEHLNWYLVPIPNGTKGPTLPAWNTIDKSIHTIEGANHWRDNVSDNMGVLLEPSGVAILDVDNVEDTRFVFENFGIDYDEILAGAPRIRGREGHDKAVFKAPKGIPLVVKKVYWQNKNDDGKHAIFEFRGGMAQDVLPPSIHPDTKKPYEWKVKPDTTELPEFPKQLLTIWMEWDKFRHEIINMCPWATTKALPPAPKKIKAPSKDQDDIIGKYNDTIKITSILERHGYKRVTPTRYLSPYSTTKLAGVIVFPSDNRIFSHHGSEPFDTSKSHDAFDLFCEFDCGGDVIRAIKEAAKILGIKTKYDESVEHGGEVAKELIKSFAPQPEESIHDKVEAARQRCLLPSFPELDNGIFKDYVNFGKKVSYSLEEFHFAALLSLTSMAIGRKAVVKVGMTKIYPNVFAIVVGQTTISGKSVACNMAVDSFGESIVYEQPLAKCYSTNILRGTISEAALIQGLHDVYNSFWFWDDCCGFFEDATTWNAHILGTMCSLYDGSQVERTLSKRSKSGEQYKWVCPTPFVSLLFNTTTKDIEQVASSRLFSSGFFPRMMWFYGQGGQPRKNEDVTAEDTAELNRIRRQIFDLREMMSSLKDDSITFGVSDVIEDWKIKTTENKLGKEDEAYRTAVSRGFIHAYKIAIILSMFDPDFQKSILAPNKFPVSTKIPDRHANLAIKIVESYLIPRTMYVYDMCNSVDSKNHQIMVMKALNHFGGVTDRTSVLRFTHLGKKDMDAALDTLKESGEIECQSVTKSGNDKPTLIIIKKS